MTHIYGFAWSQLDNVWVVAKTARGPRRGPRRNLAAALMFTAVLAEAAPIGGQVVAGTGAISQSGSATNIQQSSQNLSLNWKSFNISAQETVNFIQPSVSAIAVNRIFDTNGTQILGRLNANGQVYLINPNGILFGAGAQVNVGALVASTLDINDASLNGNARTFSGNGSGSIVNQGTINAASGGYVALLGNHVSNRGVITAHLGTVALGAGSAATLAFSGNRLVRMQVDQSVLNSLAENGGLIRADGGMVLMSAGAKDALLASVVNNTGVIEARTVEQRDGTIVLLGGMAAGTVNVGGTFDASAPNGGNGGFIETSAAHVMVADDVHLTTTAPLGLTGTWLIDPYNVTISNGVNNTGGSFAANTNDSIINASTLQSALGSTNVTITTGASGSQAGNITVTAPLTWSATTILGLSAAGAVAINAPISITGAGGLNVTATAQPGVTTTGLTFANGASVDYGAIDHGGTFTLNGNSYKLVYSMAQLDAIDGLNAINGAGVTTYGAGLTGNYALATNLNATGTTYVQALIGTNSSDDSATQFTGRLDGVGHTLAGLTINAPARDQTGLVGYLSGVDASISNIGLVGGGVTARNNVGALAGWIDEPGVVQGSYSSAAVAGSATNTGGLIGFSRGLVQGSYATGNVTGDFGNGGLVGWAETPSTILNSYASGTVSGVTNTGGLAGLNSGTVKDSHATGTVSGSGVNTGGLIASQLIGGTVAASYASGAVTGGSQNTGGLIGRNAGSVQASYATGAVTSSGNRTGGLIAYNLGAVQTSYATGAVSGAFTAGGLIGQHQGSAASLQSSYATGTVSGTSGVGGLVGVVLIGSTVLGSFWDTQASGRSNGFGTDNNNQAANIRGMTTAQMRAQANFTSATAANGNLNPAWDFAGTWTMYDTLTAPLLRSFLTPLTVTANSAIRTYDGLAYSGVNGVTYSVTPNGNLFGTVSYAGTSQGAVNAGTYPITPAGQYSNQQGYLISYASGALSVNPAALTVTANAASRLYGASEPAFSGSVTGFVGADTLVSATTGTEVFSTNAVASSNVGSYAVTGAGLTANNGNYTFVQAVGNTTALTINPATLTVTANAASRLYRAAEPAFSGSVTGFVAGDTLVSATTGTEVFSTNALLNSNVGGFGITGAGLAANHGNYIFAQAAGNATALAINPAALTVTAHDATKLYDGGVAATTTATVGAGALYGSDTLTGGTFAYIDKNVGIGNKAVTVAGVVVNDGNGGANYIVSYANNITSTISAANLAVTGVNASNKIFDGTTAAVLVGLPAVSAIGTDIVTIGGSGAGVFASPNVGTSIAVTVSGFTLAGADAGNYAIVQPDRLSADITSQAVVTSPNTGPAAPQAVLNSIAQLQSALIVTADRSPGTDAADNVSSPAECNRAGAKAVACSGQPAGAGTLLRVLEGGVRLPQDEIKADD
ncbi:MAG: filamentous hemagglutinin family N-terminal domain protein [Betaproteobacteria bacterium]|nr:filamentous hemagglutinin family N-terminal domain protein [Betaproteobacteria bacterium]